MTVVYNKVGVASSWYILSPIVQKEDGERNDKRLKYTARPPKSLTSTFLRDQKQKKEDRLKAEEEKKREEEAARIAVRWSHPLHVGVVTCVCPPRS